MDDRIGDGRDDRQAVDWSTRGDGHHPSKRTCAIANASECVIVTSVDWTFMRSARAAAPPCNRSCGGPNVRKTSMSFQRTPREWPVPSAFIAASFAANRPAR